MADVSTDIIFRTVVDTGDSSQKVAKVTDSIENLDKATENLSKENTNLNKTFSDVYGDLQPLTARMGELEDQMYELALAGKANTEEYKELQAESVKYKQTIQQVDASVDALAQKGANIKAALELGANITAGYGALQGAMALVGGESEELQETMVKLTAVQSVLNGIEQIRAGLQKESLLMIKGKAIATKALTVIETVYAVAVGTTTGAMKALRIAMLALPIIAIIAGIALLVSWLASLGSETEDLEASNDKLTESFERQNKAMQEAAANYERDINNKIRLAKLQNANEEEILGLEQKRLAIKETGRKQELKAIQDNMKSQLELYQKAYVDQDYELATKIRKEYVANRNRYNSLKNLDGQYLEDSKALRLQYENEQKKEQEAIDKEASDKAKEAAKKREEARKAEAQKRLEETRMYEDLITTNIQDEDLRRMTELRLQQQRELEEVRNKYGARSKVIAELEIKQEADRTALTDEFRKAEEEADTKSREFQESGRKAQAERELKSRKAILEAKLLQTKGEFDAQQKLSRELAKLELEEALAQEGITMGEKLKLQEEYNAKIDALDEELAQKQIERRKRVEEAATAVSFQGLEAVQTLSDAIYGAKLSQSDEALRREEEANKRRKELGQEEVHTVLEQRTRLARKQFEINKKLQIAQAIVQGVQATLAAYSSGASIPVVGAVTGPLFAALAAATAVANVIKIKNSTFESPGSGSSTPSVSPPSIPDFNATTQTAGLTGSGTEQAGKANGIQPVGKVVLVDSDLKAGIKETQKVDVLSSIG